MSKLRLGLPVDRRRRAAPQPTRGKTAANRLRRTDLWVLLEPPGLDAGPSPLYVDVGYGRDPTTVTETLARLRRRWPTLRAIGVEADPDRVATAASAARPGQLEFRQGGFDLPLLAGERPSVIRALNVLRQYDEREHPAAIATMGAFLADGGILLEGTSSPTGRLLVFHVFCRRGNELVDRWLVFSPNLHGQWRPGELRAVLPRDLLAHCGPGTALDRFIAAWERADAPYRSGAGPLRMQRAAKALAAQGYRVRLRPGLLRRGFLAVAPLG